MTDDSDCEWNRDWPRRHYTDPLCGHLPELERCMIRHRALQMILILYHAEELKRDVINGVAAQEKLRRALDDQSGGPAESTERLKDRQKQKRAFDTLVRDGVLTADERRRMVNLIGQRNSIAHHLDQVTADLSTDKSIRNWVSHYPNRQTHDYQALDQLRAARQLLSERMVSKHYIIELSVRPLFFNATEKVLMADLKALESRISKLLRARRDDIRAVNDELSLEGTELTGTFGPGWPENRYGQGRLTPRGIEICYRLFDMGKSPMAVAHLMGLSLSSARWRQRLWAKAGGNRRIPRDFADIASVRVRHRCDD